MKSCNSGIEWTSLFVMFFCNFSFGQNSYLPLDLESLVEIDVAEVSYTKEPVVIQGLVSPQGQAGWPGRNDSYSVHCLTFVAWHRINEPVARRELTVLRAVSPGSEYFKDFAKYSVQKFRVLPSETEDRAIVIESLPMESPDTELEKIAVELQKPLTVTTALFGELLLDRSMNWFTGKASWMKQKVEINFPTVNDQPAGDTLKTAEILWSNQAHWQAQIEQKIVSELLDLKNTTWLQDDEPKFTRERFLRTMTLTTISLHFDGEFEFWFDDGDLFWGHAIMVRGNLKKGIVEAGIHG